MPLSLPPLILASGSPRRRQLLETLGWDFRVVPSGTDETHPPATPPEAIPELLARRKAQAVAPHHPEALTLAADTVVILQGQILEKPADVAEAGAMLRRLSGRTHTVVTGVALAYQGRAHSFAERTEVTFAELLDADIAHYLATTPPLDKAGAYGVQDYIGLIAVRHLHGCYYTVMGLPTSRLVVELRAFLGQPWA